jgi:hypothetical protein
MTHVADNHGTLLESEIRSSLQAIRGALIDLFNSVDVDPAAPQAVARTIGINRNLAWKLSKLVGDEELLATVEHLPGGPGLSIMLDRFKRAGAPASVTARVREAMESFDRTVDVHVGDRATLELMLGHMLPRHLRIERGETARKLAFNGMSVTWGIQAHARLVNMFYAPNADDPSMVDVANISALIGYRRLRAGTSWPLIQVHGFQEDGTPLDPRIEPLDSDVEPGEPPLLRAFCRGEQRVISAVPMPGGIELEVGEGPLGNHGRITSVFGQIGRRFASCYRDEVNTTGEQVVQWFTPVECSVIDMIVHRALPFEMPPSFRVYGHLTPYWGTSASQHRREPLPLAETVQYLGEGPPMLSTPLIPEYTAMTELVYERLGWDSREFAAYRVFVKYPPVPSMAVLSFPLAHRPDDGAS